MSDREEQHSPASSDYEQPSNATVDSSVLSLSLNKEQLRTVALQRLSEVRSQLKTQFTQSQQHNAVLLQMIEQTRTQTTQHLEEIARLRSRVNQLESQHQPVNTQQHNNTNVNDQLSPQSNPMSPVDVEQPRVNSERTKPSKPEKFSATDKTHNIENFLFSMERYLRLSRTDKKEHIDTTATFFTGTALEWWQSMEKTEGEGVRTIEWSEFRDMCLKRFMPIASSELAAKKIVKWKQTGSIASYISSFQSLAQQIPFSLLPKEARVLYFVEGLNTELQRHVKTMRPKTMEDAINFAQSIGSVSYMPSGNNNHNRESQSSNNRQASQQFYSKNVGTRGQPIYLESVNTEVSNPRSAMTVTSPTSSLTQSSRIDLSYLNVEQRKLFNEGRCFNCKQTGHRRRECRNTHRSVSSKN